MDSKIVSRMGWSLVLRGVLAVAFGIVALIYTSQTLLALVYVFGVFAVLSGIATLVTAMRAAEAQQHWGWLAAGGIVGVAAGVLAFTNPGITALAFVYLIAAWAIVTGMLEIAYAFAMPDLLPHAWLAALAGAISVLFGFLMAGLPRAGALALTWLIGVYAIVYGAVMLFYAYRLMAVRKEVRPLGDTGQRRMAS